MSSIKKTGVGNSGKEKGFALVTALLAIMILLALGFLALTVTTGDLRITSRVVGEKKAMAAAETGIHRLVENFDPTNMAGSQVADVQVGATADPDSRYTVSNLGVPASGAESLPLKGYAIGGGKTWGQRRYMGSVTGVNTRYTSSVTIALGMGFGPVPISPQYE
jgi:Tfp pilus assembly protein PilX